MTPQLPVEFLVAVFKGELKAEQVWKDLTKNDEHTAKIEEVAFMRRSAAGEIAISEPGDWGLGRGAALGGVVGALAGVVLGPAALATGAVGAAIGGLAARLYDTGFDNEDLKALSESLEPDTSALLVAAEGKFLAGLHKDLEESGAAVVADALQPKLVEQVSGEFDGFLKTLKEVSSDGLQAEHGKAIDDRVDEGRMQYDRRDIGVYKTGV